MSFWCLQFLPKNERKQVALRYHSSKVEFFFVCFLGELRIPKSPFEINWPLSKSVHQLSSNIATALLVLTLFSIENPSTQLSNLSLLTQFAAVGKQEAYCAEQKRRQNVVQKYMYNVVKRVFSVLFVLQLIEKTTIRHTLRDAPIATRLVGGPQ